MLKAPNAALRFRPPGESAAGDSKKGGANDGSKGDVKGTPAVAPQGQGAQGQGAQFRERLVTELKLDAEQQGRLDPILGELRNKFMAARDLPEEQRGKALAAARNESRARIEDILKPEQKARYAELVAEQAGRAGTSTRGRVWVLADGKPKAIEVRVGLTDGTATEIAGEGIEEGAEVLIGTLGASSGPAPTKGGPPRMFF